MRLGGRPRFWLSYRHPRREPAVCRRLSRSGGSCFPQGVAKPREIDLPDGTLVQVIYEDRSVMVLDKPAGWLVAPDDWIRTGRNLFLALREGMDFGDWWATSRNLRFLRFVHRLDAETSGLLLCVKSEGAMGAYSKLFAERDVEKIYLAVVDGTPPSETWIRRDPLGPDESRPGRQRVDPEAGREAETSFRVLARVGTRTLVEARPVTGRTHQIRLHLKVSDCPVVGDDLYGHPSRTGLGLRAVGLSYLDPFQGNRIRIHAPTDAFCVHFGFPPAAAGPPERPPKPRVTGKDRGTKGPSTSPPPSPSPSGPVPKGETIRRPKGPSAAPGPSAGGKGQRS